MSDDGPITRPDRPLTATGTLVVRVETILDEIARLRQDVAALGKSIDERVSLPPPVILPMPEAGESTPDDSKTAAGAVRPSLAVKAAEGTTQFTKVLMIAAGILSVAGQIVAVWKPAYAGPIVEALRLLASLGGG